MERQRREREEQERQRRRREEEERFERFESSRCSFAFVFVAVCQRARRASSSSVTAPLACAVLTPTVLFLVSDDFDAFACVIDCFPFAPFVRRTIANLSQQSALRWRRVVQSRSRTRIGASFPRPYLILITFFLCQSITYVFVVDSAQMMAADKSRLVEICQNVNI